MEKLYTELKRDLSAEMLEKKYNDTLKKESKNLNVNGFRKGKAPLNIIEQVYGEQIKSISLSALIHDVIKEEKEKLKKENINIIGDMVITDVKDGDNGSKTITLKYYKAVPITTEDLNVKKYVKIDKNLNDFFNGDENKEVDEKLKKMVANYTPVEREIRKGDMVIVDVKSKNEKGEIVSEDRGVTFVVEEETHDLIGKGKGEVEIEKDKGSIIYTVNEIKEAQMPDLTDDIALEHGYKTIDEMRKAISNEIKEEKYKTANYMWNYFFMHALSYAFMDIVPKGEFDRNYIYDYIEKHVDMISDIPETFKKKVKKEDLYAAVRENIELGFYVVESGIYDLLYRFIIDGLYMGHENELKENVEEYKKEYEKYVQHITDEEARENMLTEISKFRSVIELIVANADVTDDEGLKSYMESVTQWKQNVSVRIFDYLFLSGEDKTFEEMKKNEKEEEIKDSKEEAMENSENQEEGGE